MRLRPLLLSGSTALIAVSGFAWVNGAAALDGGFGGGDVLLAQAVPPAAAPPAAGGGPPPHAAKPAREHMRAPNPKAMCQDDVARRIGHRAYLKARLDLKPEQMSAWNAFEKAADAASTKDMARCASLSAEIKAPPTYTERLDLQETRMKARLEAIQAIKPSLETLYAALTPEQKALFDRPQGRLHRPR